MSRRPMHGARRGRHRQRRVAIVYGHAGHDCAPACPHSTTAQSEQRSLNDATSEGPGGAARRGGACCATLARLRGSTCFRRVMRETARTRNGVGPGDTHAARSRTHPGVRCDVGRTQRTRATKPIHEPRPAVGTQPSLPTRRSIQQARPDERNARRRAWAARASGSPKHACEGTACTRHAALQMHETGLGAWPVCACLVCVTTMHRAHVVRRDVCAAEADVDVGAGVCSVGRCGAKMAFVFRVFGDAVVSRTTVARLLAQRLVAVELRHARDSMPDTSAPPPLRTCATPRAFAALCAARVRRIENGGRASGVLCMAVMRFVSLTVVDGCCVMMRRLHVVRRRGLHAVVRHCAAARSARAVA